ncbi:hypothetical protein [Portibacter lacus]|uniref:Uncharacterized protein n=1 Tax=Portibacter lacus TaxID=1099794 RepID=A0AA37SLR2_9BACT|nr:hypothetical protein [Portibacter lacus]GLR16666.1 hypothetical protein GCM10007940_12810 [Portibacter lacus]
MKTFLKIYLSLLVLLLLSINTVNGQKTVNLITDGTAVSAEIDEQLKGQIFESIRNVLNRYYEIASFWDENAEAFDEEKYSQFIGLFSGSARVYDDIADKPTNIEYSTYANNVFQYMQEEGVQFLLENVYLNSVERDESGFYVANLDMDKIVFVGLDKENFPVKFGDGKRYTLNVQIDMPDYDINDPKIQSITGEEAAKRVKTPAYLTGNFHYGIGSFIEGTPNTVGESFGTLTSKSASTLGFQLLMRKALNPAEKFWFHLGVGAQQHSLKTGYNDFNNSGLPGEETSRSEFIGANVNGMTPQPYTTENGQTLLGNVTINKIDESQELLNVITIDVPLGITFRPSKTYKSRYFIDLSIVPSYSLSSSGSTIGKPEGVIIPDSDHFPSVASILEQPDGAERLENYTFGNEDFEYTDNDVSVGNNFGLGVQLSPTYMYDISFNYGIEIGVNLWYNALSLLGNNNSTNGYLKSQYANKSFGTKSSILEDYYSGVNPFYASLKIGFHYKIN